ncbi:MAG: redoxin family protein [Planctomycetaceae bacterium]
MSRSAWIGLWLFAGMVPLAGGGATADEGPGRDRLEKSLRQVAALKSLAYEASGEVIVADASQAPAPVPAAGGGRIPVAAATPPDPATFPRKKTMRKGRVVWQRLPDSDDGDPRVKFSLTGSASVSDLPPLKPAPGAAKPKGEKAETKVDEPTEIPLRAAFNGKVLRIVNTPQSVVEQYASDEGELPAFQTPHVAALLLFPFATAATWLDDLPPGTRYRELPAETIDGTACPGVEVITRVVSDTEEQTGSRAASPTVMIRIYLDPQSDLPRRMATSAPQLPGAKQAPVFTTVDFTRLQPNAPVDEAGFEVALPPLHDLQEFEPEVQSNVETGDDLPEVTLTDRAGKERRLDEFRGELVLIEFWASWSPQSKLSLPGTQQLQDEFGQRGLRVIALSLDVEEELDDARKFLDAKKFSFLTLFDGSDFAEDLGLKTLPHLILLDRTGKVLYQHTGDSPKAEKRLRRRIVEQLSSKN